MKEKEINWSLIICGLGVLLKLISWTVNSSSKSTPGPAATPEPEVEIVTAEAFDFVGECHKSAFKHLKVSTQIVKFVPFSNFPQNPSDGYSVVYKAKVFLEVEDIVVELGQFNCTHPSLKEGDYKPQFTYSNSIQGVS